ncbi:MAG: EamA family transporter [Bacteroides sp.]|nr:EamA family transporter [Bacteroides sp.]MCM1084873.1 EamA family transporter [Bacteroides sp.]
MMKVIFWGVIQAVFLAAGQVSLKMALERIQTFQCTWNWLGGVLRNPYLLLMGICFTASGLLWLYMLRRFPFSVAYPVTSLAYVFGIIAAILVFHENVSLIRWGGVCLIMFGVFLVTGTGAAQERIQVSVLKQKQMETSLAVSAKLISSMVCDFEQIKYSSLLEGETVLKGRMYYRSEGLKDKDNRSVSLRWEYEDGLAFVFSDGKTQVSFPNGKSGNSMKASRFFKEIINMVLNAVSGKIAVDSTKFSAIFQMDAQNYYMVLTPVQREIKSWISLIELSFDLRDYSGNGVEITDKNGDKMIIKLLRKQTGVEIAPEKFLIQ